MSDPYDVEAVRRDFPILERTVGAYPLTYLDSANTSQKPRQVVEAIADHYLHHNANVARAMHVLGAEATAAFEGARTAVAAFIGAARSEEVVFTKNASEALNLAVRYGKLALPLLPGVHAYQVVLRQQEGVAARTRTAAFDLRAPVANIALDLQLPRDRWVLWAWGPSMGPAVLYWSQLAVLLVAAWLLARYAPTPLRFHHWLLLGLGFSAFAWSAYALVVAWLIAMGIRARIRPLASPALFNLAQVGLAVLTALALLVLVGAVPRGLLGLPDMHVAGNGSNAWNLRWFADQSTGVLPRAGVLSVSLWVYKLAMLAWALWLANALIGWLRWAFSAWSEGGYWRPRIRRASPPDLPTHEQESAAHD